MASLKDKVQNALDEGRILILGVQVLLGFAYRAAFEDGFATLPPPERALALAALVLLLAAFGLLVAPVAYHRIVERGDDSGRIFHYVKACLGRALAPLAVALGLQVFLAVWRAAGTASALAAGAGTTACALWFWYGIEFAARARRGDGRPRMRSDERSESALEDKIRHVLTEARMVLPGAQALLGFQFITTFTLRFVELPRSSQWVHLASLGAIALCTVFLITPAAWHRIVEHGEPSERFHRLAGRMVLAAMVPLALGLCGDLFVVVRIVTDEAGWSALAAALAALALGGLWFGVTGWRRTHLPRAAAPVSA